MPGEKIDICDPRFNRVRNLKAEECRRYLNERQLESRFCRLGAGDHFGEISYKKKTSSGYVSESKYKNRTNFPKHSHELAFFTLVLEGNYVDRFDERDLVYKPMSVLWRKEEICHSDRVDSDGGRFFFVEISNDQLEKLHLYTNQVPERLAEQSGSLAWLAVRLRNEVQNWQTCSSLIAEGITLEMLGHLALKGRNPESSPPKWLLRVTNRINDDFVNVPSTSNLAKEADVHPVHLAAVFRRFHKQTIGEYVQKLRIEKAAQLMLNRELPLSQIALDSGFSDQSHFTRIFKRHTGTTPGAFRKTLI